MIRFAALALATLLLPLSANAAGLLPMQSARKQAIALAKDAGFLAKGTGQTPRFKVVKEAKIGNPGSGMIAIWGKGGSPVPGGTGGRVEIASAKLKIQQGIDGQFVTAVKQGGSVWQYIEYANRNR